MADKKTQVKESIESTTNQVVWDATTQIFKSFIAMEDFSNITDDICDKINEELVGQSILSKQLGLTGEQVTIIKDNFVRIRHDVIRAYNEGINKDERRKESVATVENAMKTLCMELLKQIGLSVNRGMIFNGTIVSVDSKSDKCDTVTIQKSKLTGDVSCPASVLVFSSNVVESFQDNCKVVEVKKEEATDSKAE